MKRLSVRDLPRLLLVELMPARVLCRWRLCSISRLYRRCRQSVDGSIACGALPALPAEAVLVMLADGLRFTFRGESWVQYSIALMPSHDVRALFAVPMLRPGSECAANWQAAFAMLPPAVVRRIRAFVTDGLRGM
jgi:hypothetical protein